VASIETASEPARERAEVILRTLAGACSVEIGCRKLHVGRTRFQELRRRVLAAAVAAVEERPTGRPRSPVDQTRRALPGLRRQLLSLEQDLRLAQTELDIARSTAGPAVLRRLAQKGGRR